MEVNKIEEIYNQTFSGLALFYRDTNLDENLILRYKPGQILNERGFTDMTSRGSGFGCNLRYLIASAHGKDASLFNPDAALYGHVLLKSNSFFKVLDVYKLAVQTQVLLLDIPESAVDLFARATSNREEEIIKKGRADFEVKIHADPLPELERLDWVERTEFPIGMNEKGDFFFPVH